MKRQSWRWLRWIALMGCIALCAALPRHVVHGEGEMITDIEGVEDNERDAPPVPAVTPALTMPPTQVDTVLTPGQSSPDVRAMQTKLAALGYDVAPIDGQFAARTGAAVEAFQADFGLPVTGVGDHATLTTLYAATYRPLRYGATGEDVKRLQVRLTELGFYHGKISGNYLAGTQEAVKAFQLANSMEGNGQADVYVLTEIFLGSVVQQSAARPTSTPGQLTDYLVSETAADLHPTRPDFALPYTQDVNKKSKGQLVKQVQQRLKDIGYYAGPVSGNYLAKTTAAVKQFQAQNALEVTGSVDERTWNALFNDPFTVMPSDTPKPTPEPTPVPFAITVDVTNQVTTVYGRDSQGDYTVLIREMLCTTGTRAWPSDLGDWVLGGRQAKWCYFPRWGGYARYWTKINGSIAFHSVIYRSVNTMDLSVKSYRALGSRASHGCIRLTVADAKWVYDNIGKGTVVTIRDDLPADPELVASLKLPPLNYGNMLPQHTPAPTPEPIYVSGAVPPMPLEKLQKNDSSYAVWWMQRKLAELGYYQGKCSGTYLGGTVNAVKAFQAANGLKTSGTADVATLERLYHVELATPTPTPVPESAMLPTPALPTPVP